MIRNVVRAGELPQPISAVQGVSADEEAECRVLPEAGWQGAGSLTGPRGPQTPPVFFTTPVLQKRAGGTAAPGSTRWRL